MADFMEIPPISGKSNLSARVMLPRVILWPWVTFYVAKCQMPLVTCHMAMCHVSPGHVSRVTWPFALWLLYFQLLPSLFCVAMSHVAKCHVPTWSRDHVWHVICHVMTCHMAMFHMSHGHVHYDCYISIDCSACYVWPWVTCNAAMCHMEPPPPIAPSRSNISISIRTRHYYYYYYYTITQKTHRISNHPCDTLCGN